MRLALLLLLQPTLIGAPVVDEKLDDALWQKAREALGESPSVDDRPLALQQVVG